MKIILPIFTVLLLLSCSQKKQITVVMPPTEVEVAIVERQTVPYRYTFVSQTSSNLDFTIEPRVNGYLYSKNYRTGKPVKRGDLLFEIEAEPYKIALVKAEANMASARSSLANAQANYSRVEPLAKIQALSQSELDAALSNLLAARAAMKVAQQEFNDARLQLSYTKIYAPHDGIGSSSNAVPGDYVGVGTNFAVLATVSYIDSVAVDLSLPMSKYLEISGSRSSFMNDSLLSNISLELSDGSIYPNAGIYNFTKTDVNSESDAIILQVLFPNLDYYLKSGQFVRVHATVGAPRSVVTVPQQCVTQTQNIFNVWVIKPDNKAEYRRLIIGDVIGDHYVVRSGLEAGEKVAMGGFFKMRNGESVVVR